MNHAPLSNPDRTSQAWQLWDRSLSNHTVDIHTPRTSTNGTESLSYVRSGAVIHYTYTGLGGISFEVEGNTVTIPATTESTTTASFFILGA